MPFKEGVRTLNLCFADMKHPPVAAHEPEPALSADPVAAVIANNGGYGGCRYNPIDGQVPCRGERCRGDKCRFSGQGDAEALKSHEEEQDDIAIGLEQTG
jgi:hypothetical protein